MRALLLILAAAWLLPAQQQSLSLASTQTAVRPGQQFALSVNYAGNVAAALQWDLAMPLGASGVAALGSAGSAANKQINCHQARCLVYGLNSTPIADGEVARYTVKVALNASGELQFTLSGVVGATGAAEGIPELTAGPALVVQVLPKEDLDGDNRITAADVAIAADQANGRAACGIADINGDGKCDILDVQAVARVATN